MEQAARLAECSALVEQDNENNQQAASRSIRHARPARRHRVAPSRAAAPATLPTRIGRARSSACRYGGTFSASVLPAAQATLEIGAKILAGGVHARRVMSSALGACRHRVGLQAGSTPACRRPDADLAQHDEARSGTPAPVAASFAVGAACAAPDARKCADSFEAPEMLEAMSTACASTRPGLIAASVDDGSQEGAITLHDVKDSRHAVLDVVQGVVTEHGSATAPDTRRCRFCIRPNGFAAESRFQRCP
ncbi:hypothetical protein [Trinickia sp.]|uniref:hypothetical protein n=1 Tax=Trinickia sp. TaxID=2571163 RepID=UPI003F803AC5